jgi:hypothetical protein
LVENRRVRFAVCRATLGELRELLGIEFVDASASPFDSHPGELSGATFLM